MNSDSALANILEILVPTVVLVGLTATLLVSGLKGRWWTSVVGLVALVGGFSIGFGAFGIPEPSQEFQETPLFGVLNLAVFTSFYGGIALLIYCVTRPARPGSWWSRRSQ